MGRPKLNQNRTQAAYETRDEKRGTPGKSALDLAKIGKRPKFYKPEEGTNKFNIIPFEVTNPNYPLVKSGTLKVGEGDWMLDLWVHQRVGPAERDFACPKQNWGKKCPICDRVHELYEKGDAESKEMGKKLKASRRVWLNVQPIVKGEPQPVELFEASHFLFAKELLDEAGASGTVIPFADPDEGRVVQFRFVKGEKGKSFDSFKSFQFNKREEPIEDKAFDEALDLSKGVTLYTAEDLEAALYGVEDGDATETGAKNYQDDEDEVPRRSRQDDEGSRGARRRQDDEDEAPRRSRQDDEDEVPRRESKRHAEDEDEAPRNRKRPAEDDEPAPEPKPEPRKTPEAESKPTACPFGHAWGTDCEKHKDCAKCPQKTWDACMAAGA